MAKAKNPTVLTPEFRVAFPNVFQPRRMNPADEPKFSICMVFPKGTDFTAMKQLAALAVSEKWGANIPAGLKSPFSDGANKPDLEGFGPTTIYINARTKFVPGLVDQAVQPIINQTDFYAGCYARAQVHAFAYDKAGNKGVSFGFSNVQKIRDGKPLGGRQDPSEVFTAVAGEADIAPLGQAPGSAADAFLQQPAQAPVAPAPVVPAPVVPAPGGGVPDFLT